MYIRKPLHTVPSRTSQIFLYSAKCMRNVALEINRIPETRAGKEYSLQPINLKWIGSVKD